MTLDEALEAAQQAANEDLRGQYPLAAQVLAAEVLRLREQVAHLERLALRSRSAGAGR
jgi:hypothetical protein